MANGIYSALSGAIAQQRSLDVVANNVANANTTGFRADRLAFQESLARAGGQARGPDDTRYVAISKMRTDDSVGSLQATGNPLDLAIQGEGFFQVQTPAGIRFTRAGSFLPDADGILRTHGGYEVLGAAGETIQIPRDGHNVQISSSGLLSVDGNEAGRIAVVRFAREGTLTKEGATLFNSRAQPLVMEDAGLMQGYLERSNVNAVAGMNELITASRAFEAFQRVIQGFKQIDQRAARDIGGRR